MKTFHLTSKLVVAACLIVKLCNGQAVLDFPEASPNSSSLPFRICSATDKLSNLHCTCNENVVSCDFSKFSVDNLKNVNRTAERINGTHKGNTISVGVQSQSPEHVELVLFGFLFPPNASRFCICNSPPNVHLTFSENYFLPPQIKNNFQRFDLFNLSGITHLKGGFSSNFHGDLYISNVNRIPEIAQYEFGRGKDEPTIDIQENKCCSPIKVNQNYDKPVLFIENSTIDLVRTRGLEDDHLWRTFILKSNVFNAVESYGININGYNSGCNVAILKVNFKNVSELGLSFRDTANLLFVRNELRFSDKVHFHFFKSVSQLNNSNLVLMSNTFTNTATLDADAKQVVSWYNIFDLWDNETFARMKPTMFQGRKISLRYNIIVWPNLLENSLDFGQDSTVSLSDNVLGQCNCSMTMDKIVKPEMNWCNSGNVGRRDGKCSIKLDAAMNQCKSSQSVDFEHLCENKQISVPAFPGVGANLTEKIADMQINSIFLARIVKEFHSVFGVNQITALKKILIAKKDTSGSFKETVSHDDQQDENSAIFASPANKGESRKTKEGSKSNSYMVPLLITLTVAVFIGILGFFIYKNKHRLLSRFGHHELPDETYTQMS